MAEYYSWWHRYNCEVCGAAVKNRAGWRWCDECRKTERPKAQAEAKRRYALKMRRRRTA